MEVLRTEDLRKEYSGNGNVVKALDGVSIAVEQGEFVAITGTSGSGKSTLLHMLGGLDRPTSGKVFVDGKDIFALKDEALTIFRRRKIGFVFQAYNLIPVLNVYENIVLPIQLDGNHVDTAYVDEIIRTLGLEEKVNTMPNQLSGGQQQRVAIARALAAKPAIVLADEPTGCRKPGKMAAAVSPVEAVKYEEIIRRKKKKTGKITILSLAAGSCRREYKKVSVVVLSLTLSVLLVNILYSIVIGLDADLFVSQNIIGDVNVADTAFYNVTQRSDDTTVVSEQDQEWFRACEAVTDVRNVYCDVFAGLRLSDQHLSVLDDLTEKAADTPFVQEIQRVRDWRRLGCEYYGIDEKLLEHMEVREGEIDPEKWATGNYAMVYSYQLVDRSVSDNTLDLLSVGDQFEVELQNGTVRTYTVMAIAEMPHAFTIKMYSLAGGMIIVPEEEYLSAQENSGALVSVLELEDTVDEAAYRELEAYVSRSDSLVMTTKKTYLDQFDTFIQSLQIAGGALVVVLVMIGILNFVNSFLTGILRRSRELAIMQAVGLTGKQMVRMLITEGVIQGILTLAVSLLLYILAGSQVVRIVAEEIWFFEYRFTVLPIAVCAPFILAAAVLIPLLVSRSVKHRSVVERIRME